MATPKYYNSDTSQWEVMTTGPAGPQGATGPSGSVGATGPKGDAGVTSVNGQTGVVVSTADVATGINTVDVYPDGQVKVTTASVGNSRFLILNGASFRAEQ